MRTLLSTTAPVSWCPSMSPPAPRSPSRRHGCTRRSTPGAPAGVGCFARPLAITPAALCAQWPMRCDPWRHAVAAAAKTACAALPMLRGPAAPAPRLTAAAAGPLRTPTRPQPRRRVAAGQLAGAALLICGVTGPRECRCGPIPSTVASRARFLTAIEGAAPSPRAPACLRPICPLVLCPSPTPGLGALRPLPCSCAAVATRRQLCSGGGGAAAGGGAAQQVRRDPARWGRALGGLGGPGLWGLELKI
jgi:hypothetical protein